MSNMLPHSAWPSQVERHRGECFFSEARVLQVLETGCRPVIGKDDRRWKV